MSRRPDAPETWSEFFGTDVFTDDEKTVLLRRFVRESNAIEGIHRTPSRKEMAVHTSFLLEEEVTVAALCHFVNVVQPGAKLRMGANQNVTVGNHMPPPGGMGIVYSLDELLQGEQDPYDTHVAYETLHPFTDGNGRSGRALWLRQYGPSGLVNCFLEQWYYDTLARSRT